ncbi:MAG TPA: carboxypeptidase-like regulatory domain-containing protein, partial [Gemmatimonadaceae bacterium]
MRTILLPGIVIAGLCPSLLASQSVRGRAIILGTGVPATEAAVVLVDSAGSIVAGTITAADGTFNVRAPLPGTYRVRVRRIGFSPDSSALFSFQTGSAVTFNPALRPFASVELPAVSVTVATRCVLAPEAGASA